MQFKIHEINPLMSFLSNLEIPAKDSRFRTRLIKLAQNRLDQYNEERAELIQRFGEKNEDGTLKTDESGNVPIIKEHLEEFNEARNDLINEVWELESTKEIEKTFQVIKKAIEEYDGNLKGEESVVYDLWCEKLNIGLDI